MTMDKDEDAKHNYRPSLFSYLEAAPIQLRIPKTGKKLVGILVDESAQGVDVQLRRTQCLVAGDKVLIARNGAVEKAIVKNIGDRGPSTRINLKWGERLDDRASVAHHA